MGAIIDFFTGIADLAIGAFEFLIGIISDIVYVVQLTGRAIAAIPGYLTLLPAPVVALLMTIFAVVVIYKILGREG